MRERPMLPLVFSVAILVGAIVAAGVPAQGQTPKRGGILNSVLFEDPPGLMAHESSTVSNR